MGTKWAEQGQPTPLKPKPGRPFYLYGADLAAQIRESLLANLNQPKQWHDR